MSSPNHSRSIRQLLAAFAVVTLVWAGSAGASNQPSQITIAYFLQWPTPGHIAQVNEWYEEEMGVDLKWRSFANGNDMSAAMASGDVQIAYSQGHAPWVVATSKGLPLHGVGIALSYAKNDQCIVHEDSGLTMLNAEKLEGQRIASPIGNSTHYKLLRTLEYLGVDADKVNIVPMNGNEASAALARGDVTMACAFGGPLVEMKKHGYVLMPAEQQEAIGIRTFDVISTPASFAEQHPELVAQFLKVTNRAYKTYKENPAKYMPTIAEAAGMEKDAAEEMIAKFSFPTIEEQLSDKWMGNGGTIAPFTKEVADFFVAQGEMNSSLDSYDRLVTDKYLRMAQDM